MRAKKGKRKGKKRKEKRKKERKRNELNYIYPHQPEGLPTSSPMSRFPSLGGEGVAFLDN